MEVTKESIRKISKFVKILYVEDDLLLQSQIIIDLVKYFENIECANSGKQALSLIEKDKFDIVILDIKLPDMSGLELAKIIKSKNNDIFIIVTTVIEDIETLKQLIDIGIEQFLLKPFKLKELFKKLFILCLQKYNAKKKEFLERERLKEINKRQQILEKLPFGIVLISDNKIEYMNKFIYQILNFDENKKLDDLENFFKNINIPELKNLNNHQIIEILKQKSYYPFKIENKHYIMEIENLEEDGSYLLIFMSLKILEEKLDELKKQLYYSEITKLPNIYQFREKLNNIKETDGEIYFFLFNIQNYKVLKNFIGKKYSYMILLNIIKKIINDLKEHDFYKEIYFFEYSFNKFIIIVPEKYLEKIKEIFKKYQTYQTKIFKGRDGELLQQPIPIKVNLNKKILLLDKSLNKEKILEVVDDEFDYLND